MGNWFVQMGKNAEQDGQGGANAGTGGDGPAAAAGDVPTPQAPPKAPVLPYMPVQQLFTAPPQQRDIQNNFSTTQQYAQRYGQSGTHF